MRFGINGLGRIGRAVLRQSWERAKHVVVHINDSNEDLESLAYLIRHDSINGKFAARVTVAANRQLIIEEAGQRWEIAITCDTAIANVDWSKMHCVIDSSGSEPNALVARDVNAPHVIVTHTFPRADFTVVFGVNDALLDPARQRVISSSICDASALAPILTAIACEYPIEHCFVTTLHPWLSYQNILDGPVRAVGHPKLWEGYYALGRASVGAVIPKPTSVGPVLESLIPSLQRRITSFSYRIPTAVVASADVSLVFSNPVNADWIQDLLQSLDNRLIRCTDEMLVSTDYRGETASAVVDLRFLQVRDRHYAKLLLWYDNEWGYAARLMDLLDRISDEIRHS